MTIWILAYLGGLLTILSPCILPVLPFVFSGAGGPFRRTGLPLLAGMAVTFAAFSTLAVVGGAWVIHANEWGRWAALALLSVFALTLIFPAFAEAVTRPFTRAGSALHQTQQDERGPGQSFVLGMATGLLWAPCAGPILGLILTGAAINGASTSTTVLLLAYSLGAATSLALALAAGGKLLGTMKKYLGADEWVRRILGAAVLVGVLAILLGWDRGILTRVSRLRTETVEQTLLQKFHPDAAQAQTVSQTTETLGVEGTLPELKGIISWINSPPLTREGLRGKVVLIDFWTYSCINCLRTLPYVQAWAAKYKDAGLVVIGVHTPEFAFEKNPANVQKAVRELGVTYPVAIDSQYAVWNAFNNRYWPAHYFIDGTGRIRHHHFGEGEYAESEKVIQQLLKELHPAAAVPAGTIEARGHGATAAGEGESVQSPETYIGTRRAENKADSAEKLTRNQWSLTGAWIQGAENATLSKAPGKITFRFHARDLHLVLGAGARTSQRFIVRLDGQAPGADQGTDISAAGEGVVREHRLYQLIRQNSTSIKHAHSKSNFWTLALKPSPLLSDNLYMLPVTAVIKAKPGKEQELEVMLRALVAPTRAESGCLQYDLHVDKNQPGLYVFVERWESESHLNTHLQSPHIQGGMARRAELIETLDIRRLQPPA